ncbi:hypothetical protein ACN38_g1152 [Penicillium nordicum]|uniref:Uncharacterized protein n=1 Tax=Penicillium nordicum TaxID=229535 RepID=A0A0M8PGT5_9EURO|nr:hypothetical protein ACN38_g1152 [Penicillium nordicum]
MTEVAVGGILWRNEPGASLKRYTVRFGSKSSTSSAVISWPSIVTVYQRQFNPGFTPRPNHLTFESREGGKKPHMVEYG